jgi:hypothetical protein
MCEKSVLINSVTRNAIAKSFFSYDYPASYAFDTTDDTIWYANNDTSLPQWIKNVFPDYYKVVKYRIKIPDNNNVPEQWDLDGSQDNVNWTTIHEYRGTGKPATTVTIDVDNETYYKFYQINVSQQLSIYLGVDDIQFWGATGTEDIWYTGSPAQLIGRTIIPSSIDISGYDGSGTGGTFGTQITGTITVSSYDGTNTGDKIFNGKYGDDESWHSNTSETVPHTVEYDFGSSNSKMVVYYIITPRPNTDEYHPKSWTFEGSNNGTTWVVLDTQSGITDWTLPSGSHTYIKEITLTRNLTGKIFRICSDNQDLYRYHRLNISDTTDSTNTNKRVAINELEMIGVTSKNGSATSNPDGSFPSITYNAAIPDAPVVAAEPAADALNADSAVLSSNTVTDVYFTNFEYEVFHNGVQRDFVMKSIVLNGTSGNVDSSIGGNYANTSNGSNYEATIKYENQEWSRNFSGWSGTSFVNTSFMNFYNTEKIEFHGWTIANSNFWKENTGNPRNYFGNNQSLSEFFYYPKTDEHFKIIDRVDLHNITIVSPSPLVSSSQLAISNFKNDNIQNDVNRNVLVMDNCLLKDDTTMTHSIMTHNIPIDFSTESAISSNSSLYNGLELEYTSSYFWNDQTDYTDSVLNTTFESPAQHLQATVDTIQKGKIYIAFLDSVGDGPKQWYLVDEINYNLDYDYIYNVSKNINLNKISELRRSLITFKNDSNSTQYNYIRLRFDFETLSSDAGWWAIGSLKISKKTANKDLISGTSNDYEVQIDGTNGTTGNPIIIDNITNYGNIITIDDSSQQSTLNYIIEKLQIGNQNIFPSYINVSKDVVTTNETTDRIFNNIYNKNLFKDITLNNSSGSDIYENNSEGYYYNFSRDNKEIYTYQTYNTLEGLSTSRTNLMSMMSSDILDSLQDTIACGANPHIQITKDAISSNYSDLRYNARQTTIQICNNAVTCNVANNYDSFSFLTNTGKSSNLITDNTATIRLEWTSSTVTVNREGGTTIDTYNYDDYSNLIRLGSKDYVAHSNPFVMEQIRVSGNNTNPTITTNTFVPYAVTSNDFMEKQGWYCEKHILEKYKFVIGDCADIFDIRTKLTTVRNTVNGNFSDSTNLFDTIYDESPYYYTYYTDNFKPLSIDYPFDSSGWHYENESIDTLYTPSTEIPTTYNGNTTIAVIRFGSDSQINIGNYPVHYDLPPTAKYIRFDFLFRFLNNNKHDEVTTSYTKYFQEINNIVKINLEGSSNNLTWVKLTGLTLSQKHYDSAIKDVYLVNTQQEYTKLRLSIYFDSKTKYNVLSNLVRSGSNKFYFSIWNFRIASTIPTELLPITDFTLNQIQKAKLLPLFPSGITSISDLDSNENKLINNQWTYTGSTDSFSSTLWHYDYVNLSEITQQITSDKQLIIKIGFSDLSLGSGNQIFESGTYTIIHNIVNPSATPIKTINFRYYLRSFIISSGVFSVQTFSVKLYMTTNGQYTEGEEVGSFSTSSSINTIHYGSELLTDANYKSQLTVDTPTSGNMIMVISATTNETTSDNNFNIYGLCLYNFRFLDDDENTISQTVDETIKTFNNSEIISQYIFVENTNNASGYQKYIYNMVEKKFYSIDYTNSNFPGVFNKNDYILYINQNNNYMGYIKLDDIVTYNYYVGSNAISPYDSATNLYETIITGSVSDFTSPQYYSSNYVLKHHWVIIRDIFDTAGIDEEEKYQYINTAVSGTLETANMLTSSTPSILSGYEGYIIYLDKTGFYTNTDKNTSDGTTKNDYDSRILFKNLKTNEIVNIPVDYTETNTEASKYLYVISTSNYYINMATGDITTTTPSIFSEYTTPYVLYVNQTTGNIGYYNINAGTVGATLPSMFENDTNAHWIIVKDDNIEKFYNINTATSSDITSPPSATLDESNDQFLYRIYYDSDISKFLFRNTSTNEVTFKPTETTINYGNELPTTLFSPIEWHFFVYTINNVDYFRYVNPEKEYISLNNTIIQEVVGDYEWILAINNQSPATLSYYNVVDYTTSATLPSAINKTAIPEDLPSDWILVLKDGIYFYYNHRSGTVQSDIPSILSGYTGVLIFYKQDDERFLYKKPSTGEEFLLPEFREFNEELGSLEQASYWITSNAGGGETDLFYYNKVTGNTSFDIPHQLTNIYKPIVTDNWVNGLDEGSNKTYFYNLNTLALSWDVPSALSRYEDSTQTNIYLNGGGSEITTLNGYVSYINTKYTNSTITNNKNGSLNTITVVSSTDLYKIVNKSVINKIESLLPSGETYKFELTE